jgi:tungstate transport system permease protein
MITGLSDFIQIVGLSISVSLAATAAATAISLPIGAALAVCTFRGRRLIVVLINAFFGLPPVVVGLVLYLMLSRSGPLGSLALLFTPTAMVIAQTILAIPIITATSTAPRANANDRSRFAPTEVGRRRDRRIL